MKFILLSGSRKSNTMLTDMREAGLRPTMVITTGPFDYAGSNWVRRIVIGIIKACRYTLAMRKTRDRFPLYFAARDLGIPIAPAWKINTKAFHKELIALNIDYGFLFMFRLLDNSTLATTKHGFINFHPSLLPSYRGLTPVDWTIKNGDRSTGITFHKVTEQIDAGPVIAQYEIPLSGFETTTILFNHLTALGARLLIQLILKLQSEKSLGAESPNEDTKPYKVPLTPEHLRITDEDSWSEIDRKVRSAKHWRHYATYSLRGQLFEISHALRIVTNHQDRQIGNHDQHGNIVLSSDSGSVLLITRKQKGA